MTDPIRDHFRRQLEDMKDLSIEKRAAQESMETQRLLFSGNLGNSPPKQVSTPSHGPSRENQGEAESKVQTPYETTQSIRRSAAVAAASAMPMQYPGYDAESEEDI